MLLGSWPKSWVSDGLPFHNPGKGRFADNPSRVIGIGCDMLLQYYNCAHGWL